MRDRLAIVDDGYLKANIKIREASLPSWLAEAALNGKYATIEELNNRAPQEGNGVVAPVSLATVFSLYCQLVSSSPPLSDTAGRVKYAVVEATSLAV